MEKLRHLLINVSENDDCITQSHSTGAYTGVHDCMYRCACTCKDIMGFTIFYHYIMYFMHHCHVFYHICHFW